MAMSSGTAASGAETGIHASWSIRQSFRHRSSPLRNQGSYMFGHRNHLRRRLHHLESCHHRIGPGRVRRQGWLPAVLAALVPAAISSRGRPTHRHWSAHRHLNRDHKSPPLDRHPVPRRHDSGRNRCRNQYEDYDFVDRDGRSHNQTVSARG